MTLRKGYTIADQYATYFVTLTLVGWVDLFTRKECKDIMIKSLKYCIQKKGLVLYAYVIMSNHIHLMVSAREESDGLSAILRDMKKFTSKEFLKWVLESGQESRKEWLEIVFKYHAKLNKKNKNFQVWQQNNQPKICLHPKFIKQKIAYIHSNPVKAGIVDSCEEYRYSSARNYMGGEKGLLDVEVLDFGIEEGYIF